MSERAKLRSERMNVKRGERYAGKVDIKGWTTSEEKRKEEMERK